MPATPSVTPEFTFKDQKVRMVMLEGEPWFVAVDALRCLGMVTNQVGNYLRHLDEDERKTLKRHAPTLVRGLDPAFFGKASHFNIISESGLSKLVMRSDKPEAKAFQDWVTRDVLPTIRKTGTYSVHDLSEPAAPSATSPAPSSLPVEEAFKTLVSHRRGPSGRQ